MQRVGVRAYETHAQCGNTTQVHSQWQGICDKDTDRLSHRGAVRKLRHVSSIPGLQLRFELKKYETRGSSRVRDRNSLTVTIGVWPR
jgi:hypothetical protein